jgi:hypothetical protein
MVKRRALPNDVGPQYARIGTYLVMRLPVFCERFKPLRFPAALTVARFEVRMPL